MVPRTDNPTGFWESVAITKWNEQKLNSVNSSWDDQFAFFARSRFAEFETSEVDAAIALVAARYAGNRPIVLKDPRISIIAPFWDAALRAASYQPNYIIMIRDPREVAASLSVRNGLSKGKGLLLWANYMLSIERDTRDFPRLFVAYRDLISGPEAVLARVQTRLAIHFPKRAGAAQRISAFLNPGLRNQKIDGPWSERLTQPIFDYYEHLLSATTDAQPLEAPQAKLESWLNELREFMGLTFE